MSRFWAHTENSKGKPHLLREHLHSVGQLASQFAAHMNPQLCEAAHWAGLLHDLGKYRDEFQQYLRDERESSAERHHAGLHDCDALQQLVEDPKYRAGERLPQIIERFQAELGAAPEKIAEPAFVVNNPWRAEFYIRMLFSSLVDADFLDTELHHKLTPRTSPEFRPAELLQLLVAEKESKSRAGELNALRNRIFQQCLNAAALPPGFYSLTVPTGGGKTISAMAFALEHAARHNRRWVIVVLPYLSIIEQNAAQYRRILDPENRGIVIEHHSAVAAPEDKDESRPRAPFEKHASEYAAENWDAPIIITTSVQFIESLFASRTSRCRKLHNIARSVVIFDEVQTLPSHLLNPLLNVLRELRENYGVSFVFSTATQPAFRHRPASLSEGFRPDEVREITTDTAGAFNQLRRVKFTLPQATETMGWSAVAEQMSERRQALCVVNVRRHAFELLEELKKVLREDEHTALFHLSSAMCAEHRLDVLGVDREPPPGTIRSRLRHGEPCLLVSTQLIEAGVDVDFPAVWRALAPLDSIVQAAGRCNREGNLRNEAGTAALGEVVIFRPEEHRLPPGVYRTATDITTTLLASVEAEALATDHALFATYFDRLYQLVPTDIDIQSEREKLHFRKVAAAARVIKDDTRSVIVPYRKGRELIDRIRTRPLVKGLPRFDRNDLRKLQRFMVNLQRRDFDRLLALRQITQLLPNLELYVLAEGLYHETFGLLIEQRPTEDFLL